jgi:hypothetical protein
VQVRQGKRAVDSAAKARAARAWLFGEEGSNLGAGEVVAVFVDAKLGEGIVYGVPVHVAELEPGEGELVRGVVCGLRGRFVLAVPELEGSCCLIGETPEKKETGRSF